MYNEWLSGVQQYHLCNSTWLCEQWLLNSHSSEEHCWLNPGIYSGCWQLLACYFLYFDFLATNVSAYSNLTHLASDGSD